MALDTIPNITGDSWGSYGQWRYGATPIEQAGGRASIPHVNGSSAGDTAPPWSPDNPLFWFAALLVLTGTGLFAISGNVRIAKSRAGASIGEA